MSGDWPLPRRAWSVVAILLLANAVSFVDRQVINLLTEPLWQDLRISDRQVGLVQGVAFGVFYTLMGLPLGRLRDQWNRRNVILIGAAVWSCMTGTSLGSGLALLIGGTVVGLVVGDGPLHWPVLGELRPWQAAFLAVGLPSLLLVPLLATIREPVRRGRTEEGNLHRSWRAAARFVWQRRGVYLGHHLGLALLAVYTFGIAASTPALLIRLFGWTPAEVGTAYGLITLGCGVPGVLAGGLRAGWLRRAGHTDANWRGMVAGAVALLPFATLAPLAGSAKAVLALLGPVTFLTTVPLGVAAAAIQEVTPNELRAQVTACYLFILNLIGLGLGPVGVGALTDHWFADPLAVGRSMAALSVLAGPLAIASLWIGWRRWRALTSRQPDAVRTPRSA